MSLQVWMPLRGDLRNQGLSDQTSAITTTPTWATVGKLGNKSLYTKTRQTTMHFPGLVGVSTYSVAYWLYIPTAIAPTAWTDMFGIAFNCAGTTVWERDERRAATTTGRHNYHLAKSTSEGSNTNAYYATREDDSANDNWVHYVLTKDNSSAKLYADGTLVVTVPAANFEATKRTMTGNVYFGDNGCEAYLNDFRIYDHCLSPMEIKELAKGLVLHYPLNRNGWGQENLYGRGADLQTTLSGLNNYNNGFSITEEDGKKCAHVSGALTTTKYLQSKTTFVPEPLEQFTFSTEVKIKNIVRGTTNPMCEFYFSGATIDGAWRGFVVEDIYVDGKRINATSIGFDRFLTDTSWHKVAVTAHFNYNGTSTIPALYPNIYLRDCTGDLYVRNVKFERGIIATPWCPNSADIEDDSTEYDCSGYGNNGIRTGTFTWSSDTPKYNVSTFFTSNTTKIQAPLVLTSPTAITMTCWIKSSSTGKGGYQMPLNIDASAYEFSIPNNGQLRHGFYVNGSRQVGNYGSINLLDGNWHHIAATFDGTNIKRYIDGQLINTTAISGVLNTTSKIYISTYGDGTSYGNINMYESDVRIYATALSADDVKSLYQNSAYIDSSGNVYGAIHMEA